MSESVHSYFSFLFFLLQIVQNAIENRPIIFVHFVNIFGIVLTYFEKSYIL